MSFDQFAEQIRSAEEHTALMGQPSEFSLRKELKTLDEHMRRFIAHSPFAILSTHFGDGRCDASPRGDAPGCVHVVDERTLLIPDRLGNKRVDSYRNILETGRIGLLFLVPGIGETLRVNGRAVTGEMTRVLSKKSRNLCELSDTAMRLTEQPAGECRPYRIQLRSFSSMFSLRSSFICKSLGTGRYADPSARFQNETARSTQILRL